MSPADLEPQHQDLKGGGVEENFIRQTLIDRMRRHRESLDEAARSLARGMGVDFAKLQPAMESIRREGRKNMLLDTPSGVFDRTVAEEAKISGWYTGAEEGDEFWPRLRSKLESGGMRDVVADIDAASTKVVAHFADPHIRRLKKRGLVVGHVQSGKTANYTAVTAKAADAGYQLFIVLAGMHNNLRRQTQVRLSKDLVDDDWAPLTTNDADFGRVLNGAAMLKRGTHTIAVVKKNSSRLQKLRDWLRDIPEEVRARVPALLLDDEADQATPNSQAARDELSKINALVRQIWAELPTGTYVGYTATPFANVFMDPKDEEELYPSDFIIDLPRPEAYFGAERVFGRQPLHDADEPDPGLDMVRDVPDEDAAALKPPTAREDREGFAPELPDSLMEAVLWFIVATAIRRARDQRLDHSSMLIHTTHYVQPHFSMKAKLDDLLDELRTNLKSGDGQAFHNSYLQESARVAEVATIPLPEWEKVERELEGVLVDVRVVVDNGSSFDRLDYARVDENGDALPETVIAVGGGTLSRGLTLEGLVVSYFTRTSNTFDTLLQMGRWFGYRPGYEDLPRIWMPADLAEDFEFLALVEEEIRQDMRHMERMGVTPRELGVRVRAHPGRLEITARNKMHHADVVRVSYSGQRLQTFILYETAEDILRHNLDACRRFIGSCIAESALLRRPARWMFPDVSTDAVVRLLDEYRFHPNQVSMRSDHITGWIGRAAASTLWNVVVVGSERSYRDENGNALVLGSVDLGVGDRIPTVNRAPLKDSPVGIANIKALLSRSDWVVDLDPALIKALGDEALVDPRAVRRTHAEGRGLILLYPISKHSVPMGAARKAGSRREIRAVEHVMGLGIVFPDVDRKGVADEGSSYFRSSGLGGRARR